MKKTMLSTALTAAISGAILATTPMSALSHQQGDFIVRAGTAQVSPDESSSLVNVGGSNISDSGLGISSDTQLGLTAAYMLTDNLAIELLASTPFEHDVDLRGDGVDSALGGGVAPNGTPIATIEHLPPTLSLQYFFMDGSAALQPYVGVGINYLLILDEELSTEAKTNLGANSLDVDDSIGIAFQIGADYQINEKWLVNAAIWNIDVETTASFNSAVGEVKADLDVDPWVYMVSVGYKF